MRSGGLRPPNRALPTSFFSASPAQFYVSPAILDVADYKIKRISVRGIFGHRFLAPVPTFPGRLSSSRKARAVGTSGDRQWVYPASARRLPLRRRHLPLGRRHRGLLRDAPQRRGVTPHHGRELAGTRRWGFSSIVLRRRVAGDGYGKENPFQSSCSRIV